MARDRDQEKPSQDEKPVAAASAKKAPGPAPSGKVWMVANADQQAGFWRGGVRWPHVARGEEVPQLVDEDKVQAVLNEPHLRYARVVE